MHKGCGRAPINPAVCLGEEDHLQVTVGGRDANAPSALVLPLVERFGVARTRYRTLKKLVNTILRWVLWWQNSPHDGYDRGSLLKTQTRPRVQDFLKCRIARAGFTPYGGVLRFLR